MTLGLGTLILIIASGYPQIPKNNIIIITFNQQHYFKVILSYISITTVNYITEFNHSGNIGKTSKILI